jgi:bacterioferritin
LEVTLDKEALLSKLNWFYSLELNQVDLYLAQSKTFAGTYESIVFERTAYIEQQHVDNIAEKIQELGGTPTKFGDVVSPIIGSLAGKLISSAGVENTLKAPLPSFANLACFIIKLYII